MGRDDNGLYGPCLKDIQIVAELKTNMAGPARRDLAWDAVLRALVSHPAEIRLRDVQRRIDADVSDRTVRRTLNAMQMLGWIEKEKEGGHYWQPGPKAREFLRVPSGETMDRGPTTQIDDRALQERVDDVEDEIAEAVRQIDVHAGAEPLAERRRELLKTILTFMAEQSEVTPKQIKGRYYPGGTVDEYELDEAADTVAYKTERSWWKNFVYAALSETDLVESGGEGTHTWFYVGRE